MRDVLVFIDDSEQISANNSVCRICHEEEFVSCKSLEAPCACSGTVKFAHRDCIQRWCNEKGNTNCEICLQTFQPGYTVSAKKIETIDTTVIIRGGLEVSRTEAEGENHGEFDLEMDDSEIDSATDRSASCCRSVALILTTLLLMGHLFAIVSGGGRDYPFSIAMVLIAKASGILLPMYILVRIIGAIHHSARHNNENSYTEMWSGEEDEEQEQRINAV